MQDLDGCYDPLHKSVCLQCTHLVTAVAFCRGGAGGFSRLCYISTTSQPGIIYQNIPSIRAQSPVFGTAIMKAYNSDSEAKFVRESPYRRYDHPPGNYVVTAGRQRSVAFLGSDAPSCGARSGVLASTGESLPL
jgi:hypothetical protein